MATHDTDIAAALRTALAQRVGQDRFKLWFGANTRLLVHRDALVVEVPNAFFQDWLRTNFRKDLEACCAEVLGKTPPVRFQIDERPAEVRAQEAAGADGNADADTNANENGDASTNGSHARQPAGRSGEKSRNAQIETSENRPGSRDGNNEHPAAGRGRRFADFSTFVVGHTNRVAHASAQMVAQEPGCLSPLYFHGATGVGKTHLLESIWTAATQTQPRTNAVYLSAEQFTTSFLAALNQSGLPSFRRKYRGVQLLILDDIHFFAGKRATVSELQHTIDTLLRAGRQVVLAGDRPLAELDGLGAELTGRLSGGMVCRVDPPDHPVRLEIVRALCDRQKLDVPEDVAELIASRLTDHARQLSGAVHRLQATSLAWGVPITRPMAEKAIADLCTGGGRVVRLPDIEEAVCEVFGVGPESLRSKQKGRAVSHPRMLAMWLARKHTRSALSEIGSYFGRRSHTTVVSAQKRVGQWMSNGTMLALPDADCSIEEAIRRVELRLRAG